MRMEYYIIQEKVLNGKAKKVILDLKDVLRIKGQICVRWVRELTRLIIKKADSSRYVVHLRVSKIYNCWKQHY